MRCFRLTIAYDGTDFLGWQWQPGQRTVQGALEAALARVAQSASRAVASSRTDAGVHALGQAVSLLAETRLDASTLGRALNANLPRDMVVRKVEEAPSGFHAIEHARGKRYRYVIHNAPLPDPLARRYAWQIAQPLDVASMHAAAQALVGPHDFRGYQSAGSRRVSTLRTVRELRIVRCDMPPESFDGAGEARRVVLEVEADGFLYNMVRNIVGTLVEVGRGKRPVQWPAEVLAAGDRRLAGMTAPPHGLYLLRVFFDF
jgi:tRNA pseudouridine38-40 synthase